MLNGTIAKNAKDLVVICGTTLLFLFVSDQVLGMLGFPAEIPYRTAHQENQRVHKKSIEFEYEFITNSQGLRYHEIPLEKLENETRILLLGDSFTEGQGVEAEETFATLLEEHFTESKGRTVRFINAGMGGTGPLVYWRVFSDRGLKYNPDGVLIGIFANDVSNMPESMIREELFLRSPPKEDLARWSHAVYPRISTLVAKAIDRHTRKRRRALGFVDMVSERAREQGIDEERIKKWQKSVPAELVEATNKDEFNGTILAWGLLAPHYWTDNLDIDSLRAERKFQTMILVLNEIVAAAREKEISVGVVYLPDVLQYDPSVHENSNPWIIGGTFVQKRWLHVTSAIQKRLADWSDEQQVPFLDLTPVYREAVKTNGDLNWKLDGHWTPQGHEVAGHAIASWIEEKDVFRFLKPATSAE